MKWIFFFYFFPNMFLYCMFFQGQQKNINLEKIDLGLKYFIFGRKDRRIRK